jgi:hypothetical protein
MKPKLSIAEDFRKRWWALSRKIDRHSDRQIADLGTKELTYLQTKILLAAERPAENDLLTFSDGSILDIDDLRYQKKRGRTNETE